MSINANCTNQMIHVCDRTGTIDCGHPTCGYVSVCAFTRVPRSVVYRLDVTSETSPAFVLLSHRSAHVLRVSFDTRP